MTDFEVGPCRFEFDDVRIRLIDKSPSFSVMSFILGNSMLVLLPAVALSPMPFQWVLKTSVGAFSTFWNLLFPQRFFKVQALSHSIMRSLLRQSSPHPFTERRISSLLRLQSHSMPMFFLLTRLKGSQSNYAPEQFHNEQICQN